MKNSKLIIVAMLFACSFFVKQSATASILPVLPVVSLPVVTVPKTPVGVIPVVPVITVPTVPASPTSILSGITSILGSVTTTPKTTTPTTTTPIGGTSLPIDSNIWFLVIAAGVIGTKVMLTKGKQAQLRAVEVK